MKKIIISIFLIPVFILGCNKEKQPENNITIGIAKLISHPALDLMEQGIMDELKEQGFTNITFDLQNSNGDVATGAEIANHFKHKKVDVVVSITTSTTLSMLNQIKDQPIVFVAVTDPIGAGIRTTTEYEDTNITGLSDMPPMREELQLIKELIPDAKIIGHIYTSGDANSVFQMNKVLEICDELGLEVLLSPINNTAEVKQAAEVLIPQVDAVFVSKDNFVVAALNSLTDTAMKYKVPVISADPSSAPTSRVMVAYGLESYLTGRSGGKVVARVLNGESPADIPIRNPDILKGYVNRDVARELGITLTESLLAKLSN